jgi:subfamily B ATP-binding cassette protein MsbA
MKGIALFVHGFAISKIKSNLIQKLRIDILKQYSQLNYKVFVDMDIGYLNNIITTEVNRTVDGFGKYCIFVANLLNVFILLLAAVYIDLNLTFVSMVFGCIALFLFLYLSEIAKRISNQESRQNSKIQELLIQTIYNFKYLKATGSFGPLLKHLAIEIREHAKCVFRLGILNSAPRGLMETLVVIFLASIILYEVLVLQRPMTTVMVLSVFFARVVTRLLNFQSYYLKFSSAMGGIDVITEARAVFVDNHERCGNTIIQGFYEGIEFKDVSFFFNKKQVIKNINLRIQRNTYIGVVGMSGAGKTTFVDLLTGLLTPDSGMIRIDGIDYQDIDKSFLRQIIGYVTQEPVIFNDSIENNISFWDLSLGADGVRKKVESAAGTAHALGFIEDTEKGLLTVIGDKGVKLSGGQRQRISIARELFRDPEILIFDEATSSLDSESEALIQESINKLMGHKTIIIIAHRLSTVRNCDYIYVLSNGEIIEGGSFESLYGDHTTMFYQMCKTQRL